jgi:hypothetical protein
MPPEEAAFRRERLKPDLLDFPVERMAAQVWIVLFLFHAALLELFISVRHVARDGFALAAGLCAFKDDVFSRHGKNKVKVGNVALL